MTISKITAKELHEKMLNDERITLLDVRAEEKFNDYHIEGVGFKTLNIPKNIIFEGKESDLPLGDKVVVTCTTGNSAAKCAEVLSDKNYDVLVLEGGITAWKEYLKKENN